MILTKTHNRVTQEEHQLSEGQTTFQAKIYLTDQSNKNHEYAPSFVTLIDSKLTISKQLIDPIPLISLEVEGWNIKYKNVTHRGTEDQLTITIISDGLDQTIITMILCDEIQFNQLLHLLKQVSLIIRPSLQDELVYIRNIYNRSQLAIDLYSHFFYKERLYMVKTYQLTTGSTLSQEQNLFRKQVYNEIRILRDLKDHTFIVKLESVYKSHDQLHLVLQHFDYDINLRQYMISNNFNEYEIQQVARQLLDIVQKMQENKIIHRDINPENILITNLQELKLRITGFGHACKHDDDQLELKQICGTLGYIDPQVFKSQPFNLKSDIFNIGCLLYLIFTKTELNNGQTKQEILIKNQSCDYSLLVEQDNMGIPSDLRNLIKGMVQPDPEQRLSIRDCLEHRWLSKNLESLRKQRRGSFEKLEVGGELEELEEGFASFVISPNYYQNIDAVVNDDFQASCSERSSKQQIDRFSCISKHNDIPPVVVDQRYEENKDITTKPQDVFNKVCNDDEVIVGDYHSHMQLGIASCEFDFDEFEEKKDDKLDNIDFKLKQRDDIDHFQTKEKSMLYKNFRSPSL